MNLFKNENASRRTYLGMKILRDELTSEKTKIGKKIPRNQLRQNISPSTHENMPKEKHSGMNIYPNCYMKNGKILETR